MNAVGIRSTAVCVVDACFGVGNQVRLLFIYPQNLVWMVWFHHHVCESLGIVPTCSSELLPNQGQTGRSVSKRLKKLLPVQMSELVLLRTRPLPSEIVPGKRW